MLQHIYSHFHIKFFPVTQFKCPFLIGAKLQHYSAMLRSNIVGESVLKSKVKLHPC